jgi:two-component system phosphate regulon response regulator PhoB
MKKIVLIEDDSDLFPLLKYNLEKEGFGFAGAQTGKGAVELCRRERPDLVILDIMLPDIDGLEVCKALRNHSELAHVPIIFLTARVSETDRIVGLELGANDYIVKPFFIRELIARIKNQFRTASTPARSMRAGALELDRASCRVLLNASEVSLTATEFRLLEFLMSRPGVVYSREQLLDAVWGHDRAVTDRTVDVYILRLRQKIEADPTNPLFIRAVRGFGYSFNENALEPVAEQTAPYGRGSVTH